MAASFGFHEFAFHLGELVLIAATGKAGTIVALAENPHEEADSFLVRTSPASQEWCNGNLLRRRVFDV